MTGHVDFRDGCAVILHEAEVAAGVVAALVGIEFRRVVEQPAAAVSGESTDVRNVQGAGFEGGPQGVGHEEGGVERLEHAASERARRFAGFESNDGIDGGHASPQRGEFGRGEHGEVQVGSTFFAGLHGGDVHHGIAEPVARADEEFERLEGGGSIGGEVEAAAGASEQERLRGFPAVVDPEPIGRGGGDLFFERAVEGEREVFDGVAGGVDRRQDFAAPAGGADGVDGDGNERRAGAGGDDRGEGGGGGEASEERGPERLVAGMLVDEDGEHAAALHEVGAVEVAAAAVESLQTEPAAVAVDETVEVFVALRLEDGADGIFADVADELGVKFPVADVIDGHDDAFSGGKGGFEVVEAEEFDALADDRFGQAGEARGAEEIGAEHLEVAADGAGDFGIGQGIADSDADVAACQTPIIGQNGPSKQPEEGAEAENHAEGNPSQHGEQNQHQKINGIIHERRKSN